MEKYITYKKLKKIIAESYTYLDYMQPTKIKAIIYLMFFTGINFKELEELRREDFEFSKRRVYVMWWDRYCYYPRKVEKIVKRYFRIEREEKNAFNMAQGSFWQMFKTMRKYGHSDMGYKLLRASFVHLLDSSPIPYKEKMQILGRVKYQKSRVEANVNAYYRKYIK